MLKRMPSHPQHPSSQVEATAWSLKIRNASKVQRPSVKIIGYYDPRRQGVKKGRMKGKKEGGDRGQQRKGEKQPLHSILR